MHGGADPQIQGGSGRMPLPIPVIRTVIIIIIIIMHPKEAETGIHVRSISGGIQFDGDGAGADGREDGGGAGGSLQPAHPGDQRLVQQLLSLALQVSQALHSHVTGLASRSRWPPSSF